MAFFARMSPELHQMIYTYLDVLSKIGYMTTAASATCHGAMVEAILIRSARIFLCMSLMPLSLIRFHYPGLVFAVMGSIQFAPLYMHLTTFTDQVLESYGLLPQDSHFLRSCVGRPWPSRAIECFLLLNMSHPALTRAADALLLCDLQVFCRPYPRLNRATFLVIFSYRGLHGYVHAEDLLWDSTYDDTDGSAGQRGMNVFGKDEFFDSDASTTEGGE